MEHTKRTFSEWKKEVDAKVQRMVGLSCDDLPDFDYAITYSLGITPVQAAREVVKQAKEF